MVGTKGKVVGRIVSNCEQGMSSGVNWFVSSALIEVKKKWVFLKQESMNKG